MFTISQPYPGIRGFTVNAFAYGSAESSPSGANALAVAYVTSNRCSSGNIEYGYYKDLTVPGQPTFAYYSDKTNCDGAGECRSANSLDSEPVYQRTSAITKFSSIRNYDGNDRDVFYSAYFVPAPASPSGYVLRLSVVDGKHTDRFATCNVNDSPRASDCATDVPVESWYPVDRMISGSSYVVLGTMTSYPVAPTFAPGASGWFVQSLLIGR
jgi:hypothetical protein